MPLPGSAAEALLQKSGSGFSFFLNFFGSRVLIDEVRREAGENPALPRNCKRGNSQSVTGEAWEGRSHSPDSESCPYSQSQETGANRRHQPLSRNKGGVHAVLSYSYERDLPAGGNFRRRNQNQSCRPPIGRGGRGASVVARR